MLVLLVMILIVSGISLLFIATFILHELGWFPYDRQRHHPTVLRQLNATGTLPTVEEQRLNDADSDLYRAESKVRTAAPFGPLLPGASVPSAPISVAATASSRTLARSRYFRIEPPAWNGLSATDRLARLSHQSGNQVIWGSRNWNHEGKGADGAGVSDLWESKRVSCRMVGLRIA